jgi:hypothetical protein
MTIKTWQERMVDAGHAASTDGMRINMHAQAEINELREALEAALQDRVAMATELARVRAKWTEESLIMEEVCRANTLLEKRLDAWDKQEPVAYRFTQNRGYGVTEFTYHDHSERNSWETAYRDNCLEIEPLYTKPKEAT